VTLFIASFGKNIQVEEVEPSGGSWRKEYLSALIRKTRRFGFWSQKKSSRNQNRRGRTAVKQRIFQNSRIIILITSTDP
jgi:hypothetical protein